LLGKKESKRDSYIRELRELHPELSSRIPEMDSAVKVSSVLGTRIGFIDPSFSFGLTVTMREGQFVAPIIRAYLEDANRDKPNPFADANYFARGASTYWGMSWILSGSILYPSRTASTPGIPST